MLIITLPAAAQASAKSKDNPLLRAMRNASTTLLQLTWKQLKKCGSAHYQPSVVPWVQQLKTEKIKLTICILIYDVKTAGSLLFGLDK